MPQSYVALITILGGGPYPDQGLPQPQPPPPQPPLGIWGPTDPRPTNPIAGWNPGTGTWPTPPSGPVDPGYSPPWAQVGGPRPSHPIYFPPPGQPPLGIWGPPDMPPGFWGGGMGPGVKPQPHPEHPIVLPPDLPPTIPPEGELPERPIDWRVGWTPETGWIVVGVPSGPHPTPSKK